MWRAVLWGGALNLWCLILSPGGQHQCWVQLWPPASVRELLCATGISPLTGIWCRTFRYSSSYPDHDIWCRVLGWHHGTTDWFQIGKGVRQGCILSPCLFNFYAEYIMRNTGLEETQAGIKIAGRNINNLRYADDTTLMAESQEELKSLLMKVKVESEKVGLKLNIQKTKIMASGPITSWKIDGETVSHFIWGLQNHCRCWLQPWN